MLAARHISLPLLVAALLSAACATPTTPTAPAPSGSAAAPGAPAAAPPSGQPAAAPRESIKAIYVALGMNGAPFWLAKEAGFFDQQGLDVELTYVAGAVQPAQALTAGDALFSSGGATSVTPARLAGADLVLL